MTPVQQVVTIAMCVLGTQLTRWLPFLVFSGRRETPRFVTYLGQVLPLAVFSMLVVYCLKDVSWLSGTHGIPELVGIAVTAGLHLWRHQMLLSIAGGTACYMLLVQLVF